MEQTEEFYLELFQEQCPMQGLGMLVFQLIEVGLILIIILVEILRPGLRQIVVVVVRLYI